MASRLDWAPVDAPTEQVTDPLVGRSFDGRYRLDSTIARGGMATVYLATDTRLDRTVAVKVMHRALADDPEFVARFTREAKAAARLSTPEVVAVFDQGTDDATGMAYLVMEYVDGRTLRDLLRERGALSPARAGKVIEPVLQALAAAHAAGLVHRDVKPENVLLADDGRVKVADFGLARAVEASGLTATTGVLLGTVAYLAPEQLEQGGDPGRVDPRTDVYAAGVLLWELLTGTPPYSGESPLSVAYRHVHEDVPPPSTVVGDLPAELDELVVRATRRDPAARPVDGGAFLAELRAVLPYLPETDEVSLRHVAEHQTVALPRPPKPAPPRRRRRGRIALLLVVLLALLAAGGGWYLGSGRYTEAPGVLKLTYAQAEAQLTGQGFSVRRNTDVFSEDVAAGLVLDQDPDPGQRIRKDGTVGLVVSKGPDRRAVPPKLIGSTVVEATDLLKRAGLRVGARNEKFSAAPLGTVIETDPKPGTKVRPGSAVALVVSKGVEALPVPDVQGKDEAEATSTLQRAGFVVGIERVFSDKEPKGKVLDQSPSRGTAARGSTVTLTVSKGPDLVAVPQVVGLREDEAKAALTAVGLEAKVRRIPGPGVVRSADPGEGSMVKRGSTVTLYVF